MNTEIENIIVNNDYAELTAEQKSAVNEWAASEEEFITMKQIIASAPLLNADVAPSPNLKASLMDTFAAAYPSGTAMASSGAVVSQKGNNKKVIYMWLKAGAAIAAVFLAVFLIYPLFSTTDNASLMAENKVIKKKQSQSPAGNSENAPAKEDLEKNIDVEEGNRSEITPAVVQQPEISEIIIPTTGPHDGAGTRNEAEAMEVEDVAMDFNSPVTTMNFSNAASESLSFSNTTTYGAANGAGFDVSSDKFKAVEHSDRIAVADLPDGSRQVIHERPELLNLLHTSF